MSSLNFKISQYSSIDDISSMIPLSLSKDYKELYRTDLVWNCQWEELLASVFSGDYDERLPKEVSLYFLHLEEFYVKFLTCGSKSRRWIQRLIPYLLEKSIELFEQGREAPISLREPSCIALADKLIELLSRMQNALPSESSLVPDPEHTPARVQKLKRLTGYFGFGGGFHLGGTADKLTLNELQVFGLKVRMSLLPLSQEKIATIVSSLESSFVLEQKFQVLNRFPSGLYLNLMLPLVPSSTSSLMQKSQQLYDLFSKNPLFKRTTRLSPLRYLFYYTNDGLQAVIDLKMVGYEDFNIVKSLFIK